MFSLVAVCVDWDVYSPFVNVFIKNLSHCAYVNMVYKWKTSNSQWQWHAAVAGNWKINSLIRTPLFGWQHYLYEIYLTSSQSETTMIYRRSVIIWRFWSGNVIYSWMFFLVGLLSFGLNNCHVMCAHCCWCSLFDSKQDSILLPEKVNIFFV